MKELNSLTLDLPSSFVSVPLSFKSCLNLFTLSLQLNPSLTHTPEHINRHYNLSI